MCSLEQKLDKRHLEWVPSGDDRYLHSIRGGSGLGKDGRGRDSFHTDKEGHDGHSSCGIAVPWLQEGIIRWLSVFLVFAKRIEPKEACALACAFCLLLVRP